MIWRLILFLIVLSDAVLAQSTIPSYTIRRDSATHITVIHSGNEEKVKIFSLQDSDAIVLISPNIKIKNGVVEHRNLTGEIFVRAYYIDSTLIGYIEFDGRNMIRELYFNSNGDTFLEKKYKEQSLIYMNDKLRLLPILNLKTMQ